jgi:hypothetical protein
LKHLKKNEKEGTKPQKQKTSPKKPKLENELKV